MGILKMSLQKQRFNHLQRRSLSNTRLKTKFNAFVNNYSTATKMKIASQCENEPGPPVCPFTSGKEATIRTVNPSEAARMIRVGRAQHPEALKAAKPVEDMPTDDGHWMLPGTFYKYLPLFEYDCRDILAARRLQYEKYGPIMREVIMPGKPVIHLFDPVDIETVLRHEGRHPFRTVVESLRKYRLDRELSIGLVNLTGLEWREVRRIGNTHMLSKDAAVPYFNAQRQVSQDLVQLIRHNRNRNLQVDDLLNDFYKWAIESISVACFGKSLGMLEVGGCSEENQAFINSVIGLFKGLAATTFFWSFHKSGNTKTWMKFCEDMDNTMRFCKLRAYECIQRLRAGCPDARESVLAKLLSTNLSYEDTMVMMLDFLIAGIDTTAHSLAFLLYHISQNPDKTDLLLKECHTISSSGINAKMFEGASYLKAFIKESSRLTPVIGGTSRVLDKDIVLSGYRVPAKTRILLEFHAIGMMPDHVPNPHEFRPERWLRETSEKKPKFTTVPFGFGPRGCIGKKFAEQEINLAIFEILRSFKISYDYGDIGIETRLMNKPRKPLLFTFEDRT